MEKSLGQHAYEAYCEDCKYKSLCSVVTLPPWSGLKPEIQQAWEAAGHAAAEPVRAALKDAISVFSDDDKTRTVTDERLDAWKCAAGL